MRTEPEITGSSLNAGSSLKRTTSMILRLVSALESAIVDRAPTRNLGRGCSVILGLFFYGVWRAGLYV